MCCIPRMLISRIISRRTNCQSSTGRRQFDLPDEL
jgi:hypothetical protein